MFESPLILSYRISRLNCANYDHEIFNNLTPFVNENQFDELFASAVYERRFAASLLNASC